jgi:hypothetical protein
MRLTLLLAACAFVAALFGVTQAGEASTQGTAAYRVTVSGSINYSWTLGWTERLSGCTTTGNGSGSESIRFHSARPMGSRKEQHGSGGTIGKLDVRVRGRQVYIQTGYMGGPVTGSVMRQGDFTLARSGAPCSETRAAPKEGCGTVDFSGTTFPFFSRGGNLIFKPAAIRVIAPETRNCVSSVWPDGAVDGFCCQVDDRSSRTLTDPPLPDRPRGSNKNNFRLTSRRTLQYPLRLMDRNVRAGTITVSYEHTLTFTRVGRSGGR